MKTVLKDIVSLESGTPQFRIMEAVDSNAPRYLFYGQSELENDLVGGLVLSDPRENSKMSCRGDEALKKQVRTFDPVSTLKTGDLVFSLISEKAAIVTSAHNGYLFTQNFVRLKPLATHPVDSQYLAYLLNVNDAIKKQLHISRQGSITLKASIKQLSELEIPALPSLSVQGAIGAIYGNQLKLTALKKHQADLERMLVIGQLKGMNTHE